MNWYMEVLRKYAEFSGRATRQEYWMFVLVNFLIAFAIAFIEGMAGSTGVLSMVYALAVFIPSLAVLVRRLHDTGKSGWWVLIAFIPLAGAIVLLIFAVLPSDSNENQFGPYPVLTPA